MEKKSIFRRISDYFSRKKIEQEWRDFLIELDNTSWPWSKEKEAELYAKQDDIQKRYREVK